LYKAWISKDEEGKKAKKDGPPAVSKKVWIGAAITVLVIIGISFFI